VDKIKITIIDEQLGNVKILIDDKDVSNGITSYEIKERQGFDRSARVVLEFGNIHLHSEITMNAVNSVTGISGEALEEMKKSVVKNLAEVDKRYK